VPLLNKLLKWQQRHFICKDIAFSTNIQISILEWFWRRRKKCDTKDWSDAVTRIKCETMLIIMWNHEKALFCPSCSNMSHFHILHISMQFQAMNRLKTDFNLNLVKKKLQYLNTEYAEYFFIQSWRFTLHICK